MTTETTRITTTTSAKTMTRKETLATALAVTEEVVAAETVKKIVSEEGQHT